MPTFSLRAFRLILLATVALGASTALAQTPTETPPGPTVIVKTVSDVDIPVELADLDREMTGTYTIRSPGRELDRINLDALGGGWSFRTIFEEAGVDNEEDVDYVLVPRPDGETFVRFTYRGAVGGELPPALYPDEDGTLWFIRHSQDGKDFNRRDWFAIAGSLTIRQRVRKGLRVHVFPDMRVADPDDAEAGDTLGFYARIQNAAIGDEYSYAWTVQPGDVSLDDEIDVRHTFEEDGDYTIKVAVTSDNGDRGSASMNLTIGDPKRKEKDPPPEDPGGVSTGTTTPAPTYDGSSGVDDTYTDDFVTETDDFDTPRSALGNQVEGTLLASLSTPPDQPAIDAQSEAASFEVPDEGGPVPPAVWAGMGALLLMGAGAGLESGRRPSLAGVRDRVRGLPRLPLRRR